MRALKLACSCGATCHVIDEDEGLRAAIKAAWQQTHSGEGHGDEDYMVAVQTRTRNEIARVQAQVSDSKPGRN